MSKLINNCELTNIQAKGHEYTWRRSCQGADIIYEKLDRILVSNQILEWFPHISTQHHAFTTSDHCKLSCDIENEEGTKGLPFKFEKIWMKRNDFKTIVKQAWRTDIYGSRCTNWLGKP